MESSGIVTTKITAAFGLTINAMTMLPNTINGDLRNSLRKRFSPLCTWLISLVIRVISVEVPSLSISANPRDWICENSTCRTFVQNPTDAFAAKYCAVILQVRPITPSRIRSPQCDKMYPLSLFAIPVLMIAAITRGTRRSNVASSILNAGARMLSFL